MYISPAAVLLFSRSSLTVRYGHQISMWLSYTGKNYI